MSENNRAAPIDKVNLLETIKIIADQKRQARDGGKRQKNAPDHTDPSLGRHHSFNRLAWSIRTGGGEDGHT